MFDPKPARPLVIDGGLSTALEHRGHALNDELWTARVLRDDPDEIVAAHRDYLRAGSQVIITASYQTADAALIQRATACARQAVSEHGGTALVAASLSPYGAVLADGSEYTGSYGASWDEIRQCHRARLEAIADSAPDVVAIETVPSLVEAAIMVEELARTSLTAWLSVTCADAALTRAGDPIEALAALAERSPSIVAFGVNCTQPSHVSGLLTRSRTGTDKALLAYPNHGRSWNAATREWEGEVAAFSANELASWRSAGAALVGGCCGIGPTEILELSDLVAESPGVR